MNYCQYSRKTIYKTPKRTTTTIKAPMIFSLRKIVLDCLSHNLTKRGSVDYLLLITLYAASKGEIKFVKCLTPHTLSALSRNYGPSGYEIALRTFS